MSLTVLLVAGLSACSAGGPATISPGDFGKNVGDQLLKSTGVTPVVDCGTADIALVDGAVVHCDISAADDPGTHYDSTTTISNVNGGDFHIDIKVADTPKP